MPTRTIRLKEHHPDLNADRQVTERIREFSDDSLLEGPFLARTDSQGFIMTGNHISPDAPELFIIGDSMVEAHFAAEDVRFASQLERGLSAKGHAYQVRNGGYSGMTSLHMLGVLTTKMPMLLKPQSKLLLAIGQSDINALSNPGLYWEQTKTVTPFGSPSADAIAVEQNWEDCFVSMVTTIVTFAKVQSYDFAITAGLFRKGNFEHDAVLQRTYRRNRGRYEAGVAKREFIIKAVRSIAHDHAIPLFDVSAEFLERSDYFYDLLHLNQSGHSAYAGALTSWASENWLVR